MDSEAGTAPSGDNDHTSEEKPMSEQNPEPQSESTLVMDGAAVLKDLESLRIVPPPKSGQTSEDAPNSVEGAQEAVQAPQRPSQQAAHAQRPPQSLPPTGPISPGLQEMAHRLRREIGTLESALITLKGHLQQFEVAVMQEAQRPVPQYPPPPPGYPYPYPAPGHYPPPPPQGYGYPPQGNYPYAPQAPQYANPQYGGYPQQAPGMQPDPSLNPFTPEGANHYANGFGQGQPHGGGGSDYL